jgi:hypothetical protein
MEQNPVINQSQVCRLGTPTRTIEDQHLMLGQNGFGDDRPETARLSEANNGCDEMDDENEQIAHNSSYSG